MIRFDRGKYFGWKLLTDNWRAVENLHHIKHTVGEIIWRFSTFSSIGIRKKVVRRVFICVYGFAFPGFPWYSDSSAILSLVFLRMEAFYTWNASLKTAYIQWWLNWIILCQRVKLKSMHLTIELTKSKIAEQQTVQNGFFLIVSSFFIYVIILWHYCLLSDLQGCRTSYLEESGGEGWGVKVDVVVDSALLCLAVRNTLNYLLLLWNSNIYAVCSK